MKFNIFEKSVIGYKNLVKGYQSQDYIDYKEEDKYIICSVADGHSTDFFKYSLYGAKFACKASIDVLSENFDMDIEVLREKLINYETYGTIELTKQGENLAKKILEAYDITYLFMKDVLNLDEEEAKSEAEKIKSTISDNTINKLAKYVHNALGLKSLNCNYDINNEQCRSCIKRTDVKSKI